MKEVEKPIMFETSSYETFEYRLVYLCPNPHADERLTVGILSRSTMGFELRLVSSVSAVELMIRLFGDAGVEQFQFAAGELRRAVGKMSDWQSLDMATDLFILGKRVSAFTHDRVGLLASVLASSSSLIHGSSARARDVISSSTSKVAKDLYHQVSLLNPLKADDLFHRKVTLETGSSIEEIELPILGNRIFGAPVSMTRGTSDQKMRAEAYVAKFRWVHKFISQQPKVYILAPGIGAASVAKHAHNNISELRAVAAASNVDVEISESMAEMAAIVINDEAA